MIDEVIEKSKFIPPYVIRAQTGPIEFPTERYNTLYGYASPHMTDSHFYAYGADTSNGYVYTFSVDPNAKHFSPYMFFKDINRGLRKYNEQEWWEEEWENQRDLQYFMWEHMGLEIDEDDKSFVGTRGVPEMKIQSLEDLSEEGLKILELYAHYANLPIEVAAQKIEHFLELRHSGIGYDPNVAEDAFYSALVDLGYAGLYEWEWEMPDNPLNFVILDPSAIDSYRMIRTEDVPPDVDANDYLQQQPWTQANFSSPPRRSNPLPDTVRVTYRPNPALKVESGYLVNPETGDTYWFHGSWTGRKRKFDWRSPRRHAYGATYFTSSEELAADFATGERVWLNFDEEPPPMKRTGYMHRVQIKDVPLVDSDNLFVDKEALTLSEEGVAFVQSLQQFGSSDADIESFICTLSGGTYHAFSKQDNSIWPSLIRTIKHLGYRGWFERESIHRSHINIGLLEPDEDARIRGGYTVKRTRRL